MGSWVSAAVQVAEQTPATAGDWFFIAAAMLIGSAVLYGAYRLLPRPQIQPQAGMLLGGAVLCAIASPVCLVVGIITQIRGGA